MRDELFDELMESLCEAAEHAEGKRDDLRTTTIETPTQKTTVNVEASK